MAGYAKFIADMLKMGFETSPIFPYDESKRWRSPKAQHIRDIALKQNQVIQVSPDSWYFDIGSEEAEAAEPHYHILENAKIIRRPQKGTKKTRGSQANIADKGKRDYNAYVLRQRTQSKSSRDGGILELIQEYRQNQSRNFWGTAAKAREYNERVKYHHIYHRNYVENRHWQYMERILETLVPEVAKAIGATRYTATTSIIDTGELGATPIYELINTKDSVFSDLQTGEVIGI